MNEEVRKLIEEEKKSLMLTNKDTIDNAPKIKEDVKEMVDTSKAVELNTLKENENYKECINKLTNVEVDNELQRQLLDALDEKQKNELRKYILFQEKKIQKQIAISKIMDKKYRASLARYGYLYPKKDKQGNTQIDDKGNIVVDLEMFTPNKSANVFREFVFNYNKIGKDTRKIISTSFKVIFTIALAIFGGWIIYKIGGALLPILMKIAQK